MPWVWADQTSQTSQTRSPSLRSDLPRVRRLEAIDRGPETGPQIHQAERRGRTLRLGTDRIGRDKV